MRDILTPRSIIGLPEHLKNPRLSKLIEFYEQWYVPENMVLVLVGNIKAQQISGRINAAFGRLAAKPSPERKVYQNLEIKGRKQYSAKVGFYPQVAMVFNGVPAGHPDEDALDIALALLNNNSQTGTMDKLVLDGELTSAGAYTRTFREQGRAIVAAIPLYDENQRRFESTKSAEKKALKAIQQIANGEFEDWKIDAIKAEKCRQFDLEMESNEDKAMILMNAFYNEQDLGDILNYKDKIMAITTDDIKRVAKKYLSDNYLALYIEKGKPDKNAKIEKPGYKPVEPPIGKESLYATQFKNLPIGQMEEKFADYGEVQIKQLNDRSKMYYTPNKENNVFQLVVQYGAGEREFPKLGYAAQLMNNAGIMGAYEPQELKEELSKLNATCHVTADDDNLYIIMEGYEATLTASLPATFTPDFDAKTGRKATGTSERFGNGYAPAAQRQRQHPERSTAAVHALRREIRLHQGTDRQGDLRITDFRTDGRHQPRLQLRGKGVLHRNTPLRPSIRYPEQEPPIGGQRTPVQLPTGKGHDAGDRKHRLLPA